MIGEVCLAQDQMGYYHLPIPTKMSEEPIIYLVIGRIEKCQMEVQSR